MAISQFENFLREQQLNCFPAPSYRYEAEIKVGTYMFKAMAVPALTRRQNYYNDMFENSTVSIAMTPVHYSEIVLRGHEDISITLTRSNFDGGATSKREYRAVLMNYQDLKGEGNLAGVSNIADSDNTNISVVDFQILPPVAYALRLFEVGITTRNEPAHKVLKYLLNRLRQKDVFPFSEAIKGINFDEDVSDRVFGEIKIKEGTPLLEVVRYLQDKYGIFQQDIGCFLRDGYWFVFAPFGVSKRDKDVERLQIINAPAAYNQGADRTFFISGKVTTIISTGEVRIKKNSDVEALNQGTGIRYANTKKLLDLSSSTDPTADPYMKPQDYMTEYRGSTYNNPIQFTVTAKERFSDNPLKFSSELAKRGGRIVTVTWEHGSLDGLRPGMPVVFFTNDDGSVKREFGTLIGAILVSNVPIGGLIEPKHVQVVELTLFLKEK